MQPLQSVLWTIMCFVYWAMDGKHLVHGLSEAQEILWLIPEKNSNKDFQGSMYLLQTNV